MILASIGTLRRRLTLESPVRSLDEAGSATINWSSRGDLWAHVEPRGGREIVDADGVAARVSHEVHLRWRSDITAEMRLRDGATVFAVLAVKQGDPRRRRLVCLVEEIAP